jgi:type II secretory pathway component PulJ
MKRNQTTRRAGFLIFETLMTLSLLAFVFAAAAELFRVSVLTAAASANSCNQASRLDSAMFSLRRDVWQSGDIRVSDPHTVELTTAEGKQIVWRINADASAQRFDPNRQSMRWESIGVQLRFVREGATLVVVHSGPPNDQALPLVSQVLIGRAR